VADTLKVLGQVAPAAATMTDLYTAPAGTQVVVSSIIVCNRGFSDTTFRVAVSPGGASIEDKHYLYYDTRIPSSETLAAQIGVTLSAGDKLRVRAGNNMLSFSAFGIEVI
jgi:hypothetical protein